jgi:hypothetical protein
MHEALHNFGHRDRLGFSAELPGLSLCISYALGALNQTAHVYIERHRDGYGIDGVNW